MLIRSRPLRPDRAISPVTGICVAVVCSLLAIASVSIGAVNYMLQAIAFPMIYFGLCVIAKHQNAFAKSYSSTISERPWLTVPTSVCLAFVWGVIILSPYFFMVMSMEPWFMNDFVRTPDRPYLTIRNTQYAISAMLSVYVLLDYARLAAIARSNLGHQTIATALVLEFLLATHFAVY